MRRSSLAVLGAAALWAGTLSAEPLAGEKRITLVEPDGTEHAVGRITFTPEGEGANYSIAWDESQFGDYFLSMRPFRCLAGAAKHWCRVPYPYQIARRVTPDDLTDLEYDLLFVWKGAGEYGINMWNGVYYRIAVEGDGLQGTLHEIDMDVLSAPPPDGELRPVREGDLHAAEPEGHWLPRLVIE